MRVPTNVSRADFGVNMTPMIDVVFQLIIFFLVSSHLAKQETHLALPLPIASSGVESKVDESPRVTINVMASGELMFSGRSIRRDDLVDRLRERRQADGESLEVRLRADRSVAYRHIEPILRDCTKVGVWNVSIAVIRPEDAK